MSNKTARIVSLIAGDNRPKCEQLLEWMLLDVSKNGKRPAAAAWCKEKFDMEARTADKYRYAAWAIHGELSVPKRNAERGKTTQEIDWLLTKAVEDIDENGLTSVNVAAIGKVWDLRVKLFGLAAPIEVKDVTDNRERPLADWPEEELATRLAELRANGEATPH